jgi:hypothetical protein
MNSGYKYTVLEQFFGAYFHQDFLLDAPDWESVCDRYIQDDGPEGARTVANEIQNLLLCDFSDDQLHSTLGDLGCFYWPGHINQYRPWLTEVSARLNNAPA